MAYTHDSYFTAYTEELVNDCYEFPPKGMDGGKWPFCHMTLDWDAAAEALKADYTSLEFDGVAYWGRS